MVERLITREQFLALDFPTTTAWIGELISTERSVEEGEENRVGAVGGVDLISACGVTVRLGWVAEGVRPTNGKACDFDININRGDDEPLTIEGVILVDADSDPLDRHEIKSALHEVAQVKDWEDAVLQRLPKCRWQLEKQFLKGRRQ